ncbi:MAG: hypothetical protein AAFY60_11170, partial [Myxococcota bacterium]
LREGPQLAAQGFHEKRLNDSATLSVVAYSIGVRTTHAHILSPNCQSVMDFTCGAGRDVLLFN